MHRCPPLLQLLLHRVQATGWAELPTQLVLVPVVQQAHQQPSERQELEQRNSACLNRHPRAIRTTAS